MPPTNHTRPPSAALTGEAPRPAATHMLVIEAWQPWIVANALRVLVTGGQALRTLAQRAVPVLDFWAGSRPESRSAGCA